MESAFSIPFRRGANVGERTPSAPYAPSTWNQRFSSRHSLPSSRRSSIAPISTVPADLAIPADLGAHRRYVDPVRGIGWHASQRIAAETGEVHGLFDTAVRGC